MTIREIEFETTEKEEENNKNGYCGYVDTKLGRTEQVKNSF